MKHRIYVASPYSIGIHEDNIMKSLEAGERLMRLGYAPMTPLLKHYHHLSFPHTYEEWVEDCLEWVAVCHAVLRLPGESRGADKEVFTARQLGLPVFSSIEDLMFELPPVWVPKALR